MKKTMRTWDLWQTGLVLFFVLGAAPMGCGSSSTGSIDAAPSAGGSVSLGGSKGTGGRIGTGGTSGSGSTLGPGGTSGAGGTSARATGGARGVDASSGIDASRDGTGGILGGVDAPDSFDVGEAGVRPPIVPAPGATLVKIDSSTKLQTFEGWGVSLAWWGDWIGGWAADKRNPLLDLVVDPVSGLGYNIFRYNIGGGDDPTHTHMRAHGAIPGFETALGTWDWTADARQVAVLSRLVAKGKGVILEAFSNSPPYWMTKSGCASGSTDGADNLKADSYDVFADYLTEVVKHFRDGLGITFRTLEPMNEPNANWWKANGSQEGCHFGAASQQQIIKAVGAKLAAKGLTGTTVSASDENSIDEANSIMAGYDATTLGTMSQMNTHSYYGSNRAQLRALAKAKGKRLWQSESGPLGVTLSGDVDAALFMADRIIRDLRELQPSAWLDWQMIDTSPAWTTFTVTDTQQTFAPNKRFYMHAGFTRWIRPGAIFVSNDHADMVSALSADGATLTVVARNGDAAASKSFTYDLTALPSLGASVEVYRTSATENLVHLPAIVVKDWSFTASLPAASITTFVISLGK